MYAQIGHNGGPPLPPPTLRWYQGEAVDKLFEFYSVQRPHDADGKPIPKNALVCLPTGTGKSLVIAEFFRRALFMRPSTRGLMVTHVKTLISQNAKKMLQAWPLAPVGIHSAGLNARDTVQPLIFGGIQSLVKNVKALGFRDFLVIDEAHLLSPDSDTMYQTLITELLLINPYLKIILLTATPYRQGLGHLTNGNIATDVVYDLTDIEGFNRLLAEGFLCPLIPKRTSVLLDVSKVGLQNGDYAQKALQKAVDVKEITFAALNEAVELGAMRNSWLVFASGVEHAEHIAEMLETVFGISTVVLHSKRTKDQNDEAMQMWLSGEVRCAVSMNMLTTGVDHAPLDFIIDLQPTMATGKHVQKYGRGTRPYNYLDPFQAVPGFNYIKENCLVADFAGNVRRLGPINDPVIPRKKGDGPPGDAPVRVCPKCEMYNHASARTCFYCGHEFEFEEKISREAATDELIRDGMPQYERFAVDRMVMVPHKSRQSGKSSIKVAYYCGRKVFWEFKSVESSSGLFKNESKNWFRQRYHYSGTPLVQRGIPVKQNEDGSWDDVPLLDEDVIKLAPELRTPKFIEVWVNREMPKVTEYEF